MDLKFPAAVSLLLPLYFSTLFIHPSHPLKILQIVPGFTNSHILFNYRLSESLTKLGHQVTLLTQMELAMVFIGNLKRPVNVTEVQIPIQFRDKFKAEGLKVFQKMIFTAKNDLRGAYDLWWTGNEFRDIRLESCVQMLEELNEAIVAKLSDNKKFDLAIGHFHDFCPVAIARRLGIDKMIWITHGPSTYNFAAGLLGLPTLASYVPHPLSASSDRMPFPERIVNVIWHHAIGIEFVNLPHSLLEDENGMFREMCSRKLREGRAVKWCLSDEAENNLWKIGREIVPVLLLNGERLLDLPRPLPLGIGYLGELGAGSPLSDEKAKELPTIPEPFSSIYDGKSGGIGVALFSLGTVSNQTNMPFEHVLAFVDAFARVPELEFFWKTEQTDLVEELVAQRSQAKNIHPMRWMPQKLLLSHPKTKLLVTHGGYNSLLEIAKAGVPAVMVPLFADQHINGKRAQRFGIAEVLDKANMTALGIESAIRKALFDESFTHNSEKLRTMLADKPVSAAAVGEAESLVALKYTIKLAMVDHDHRFFALNSSNNNNFVYHLFDVVSFVSIFVIALTL